MNFGKFLTMVLEDGERVVRLRGGRGSRQWKSDRPHAGYWGPKTDYVLVPCQTTRSVNRRSKLAVSSVPGLEDRSSEVAVLLLGPPAAVERLLLEGPAWARALLSRKGLPRSAAQQESARRVLAKPAR